MCLSMSNFIVWTKTFPELLLWANKINKSGEVVSKRTALGAHFYLVFELLVDTVEKIFDSVLVVGFVVVIVFVEATHQHPLHNARVEARVVSHTTGHAIGVGRILDVGNGIHSSRFQMFLDVFGKIPEVGTDLEGWFLAFPAALSTLGIRTRTRRLVSLCLPRPMM